MYDKVCKRCGRLLSDFYDTGMLGCEHCYEAFEKAADGKATKIIVPSEIQSLAGAVTAVTEIAKESKK